MRRTLLWLVSTLVILVGLTASFILGVKFSSHFAGHSQTGTLEQNIVTVMMMRSALDAHHKGDNKDLYTTLCRTLYSNAVQLLASVDTLPKDHRWRKSAVILLGQAANYKKFHPESLIFLTTDGIIPPESVESFSAGIKRLDEYVNDAEQNADGNPH